MSLDQLQTLQDVLAFNPTPSRSLLAAYHSPTAIDQALVAAAVRGERIVVVGRSGTGKSSVLASQLTDRPTQITPIWVGVAAEAPTIVTDPAAVARIAIQSAVDSIETPGDTGRRALIDSALERPVDAGNSTVSAGPGWFNVARELNSQASHQRRADAVLDALSQLLIEIAHYGTRPVLVFDDTDRWLATTHHNADQLAAQFFGVTIRSLIELPGGLVVAAHDAYLEDPATAATIQAVLPTRFDVPILNDVDGLEPVIASRINHHLDHPPRDHIIDDAALGVLFDRYRNECRQQIRGVLRLAHSALAMACDSHQHHITAPLAATAE